MLLKTTDDKSGQIARLESLLSIAGTLKSKIELELRLLKAGIKGEQDAAYLIDFDFKSSDRMVVIHDLRLDINGRVAQIDHLLIHRSLNVFVLETKNFHAGLKITDDGEFLRWNQYKGNFEGMASPLAQNERHIRVLRDAFDSIEMPTRLGIRLQPTFHSIVLIDPKARIDRPKGFDASQVIKADMLTPHIQKLLDKANALALMANFIGIDTLEGIGRNLAALHRPIEIDYAAKFGLGTEVPAVKEAPPQPVIPATQPEKSEFSCKACSGTRLSVTYGKYGYYFKCADCNGNTPIRIGCGIDGHKERIRKEGSKFFRECAECKSSELFFENAA